MFKQPKSFSQDLTNWNISHFTKYDDFAANRRLYKHQQPLFKFL